MSDDFFSGIEGCSHSILREEYHSIFRAFGGSNSIRQDVSVRSDEMDQFKSESIDQCDRILQRVYQPVLQLCFDIKKSYIVVPPGRIRS